jgi:hypothetical protein
MALPSSGAITLSDVNTNIGASSTANITMNDTAVRLLSTGTTTTNPVTMNGLYGKSWVWATNFSVGSSGAPTSAVTDAAGNNYTLQLGTVVVKTNPVGIIQWATQISGASGYSVSSVSFSNSLAVASSGNVYWAVRVSSTTTPFPQFVGVVKLNSSGVIQWSSLLSTPSSRADNLSIGIDSAENVYISTYNVANAATNTDNGMCVAKYNTSGSLQWQKRLQLVYGVGSSQALVVDAINDYVYLCGLVLDSSLNTLGGLVGKYDTNLSPVWQSLLSSSFRYYYGCAVNPTTQTVCGITDNLTVVQYNSSGSVQWSRTLASGSIPYTLALDSSNNTYAAFKQSDAGAYVKLDSSGNLSSQVKVTATNIGSSNAGFGPVRVTGSFVYSAARTATASIVDGMTVFKIPAALTTSGTYGRITFAAGTVTSSTPSLSFTAASITIVSTAFSQITSALSGTNIAGSYTTTVSPI